MFVVTYSCIVLSSDPLLTSFSIFGHNYVVLTTLSPPASLFSFLYRNVPSSSCQHPLALISVLAFSLTPTFIKIQVYLSAAALLHPYPSFSYFPQHVSSFSFYCSRSTHTFTTTRKQVYSQLTWYVCCCIGLVIPSRDLHTILFDPTPPSQPPALDSLYLGYNLTSHHLTRPPLLPPDLTPPHSTRSATI